ncbi:MAG: 30S ribosomal protein S8 [Candidatus Omnitrophica bacterium]|nr:30S ribosomal protein S8 [Candidatus Omnitrophota bacterium]
MSLTDPVADVLTKIRNASRARHGTVEVRASKLTQQILSVLKEEGFIRNYKPAGEAPKQSFRVYLKYVPPDRTPTISEIIRVSKPGLRSYRGPEELPRLLGGLGRAILTTSKGVMTDQEARRQRVGGEVLCYVW